MGMSVLVGSNKGWGQFNFSSHEMHVHGMRSGAGWANNQLDLGIGDSGCWVVHWSGRSGPILVMLKSVVGGAVVQLCSIGLHSVHPIGQGGVAHRGSLFASTAGQGVFCWAVWDAFFCQCFWAGWSVGRELGIEVCWMQGVRSIHFQ